VPPPPLERPTPLEITEDDLLQAAGQQEGPAWRVLLGAVAGVSGLLAQEVLYRATGRPDAPLPLSLPAWRGVIQHLHALFAQVTAGVLTPCLARDQVGAPVAFAPYALTRYPQREPMPSTSAAIEAYFAASVSARPRASVDMGKAPLLHALQSQHDRLAQRQAALERELTAAEDREQYRHWGELVLAYGHALPSGAAELQVDGETIPLDPTKSVAENAEGYFDIYKRKKRAATELPALLDRLQQELAYLEQTQTLLEAARTPDDVQAIRTELREQGVLSAPSPEKANQKKAARVKQREQKAARPLTLWLGGFQIMVGRSGMQNEAVLRMADPDDLWLHARGVPGAHVVLRVAHQQPPEEIILQAAAIAAYYSRPRTAGTVEVDVTQRKYVRRMPGARPGLVTYVHEHTLRVRPAPPELVE